MSVTLEVVLILDYMQEYIAVSVLANQDGAITSDNSSASVLNLDVLKPSIRVFHVTGW